MVRCNYFGKLGEGYKEPPVLSLQLPVNLKLFQNKNPKSTIEFCKPHLTNNCIWIEQNTRNKYALLVIFFTIKP